MDEQNCYEANMDKRGAGVLLVLDKVKFKVTKTHKGSKKR